MFKIFLSVLVACVAVVQANSQDENLEKVDTGPELPTIDNIVQASDDNIEILLGKQLKENIKSEKRHRPLLIALLVRGSDNSLEF